MRGALGHTERACGASALVSFDVIRHEHNISGRYGCRESKSSREEHPCHLGGNAGHERKYDAHIVVVRTLRAIEPIPLKMGSNARCTIVPHVTGLFPKPGTPLLPN